MDSGRTREKEKAKRYNPELWVTMEKVVEVMFKFQDRIKPRKRLPVQTIYEKKTLLEQDSIIILMTEKHFIAGLYRREGNKLVMGDGTNEVFEHDSIRQTIRELTGINPELTRFRKNTKADQCASAAVAIGVDMLRKYNRGDDRYGQSEVGKTEWERIVAMMGQKDSKPQPGRLQIQEQIITRKCRYCEYTTTKRDRRAWLMHERWCSKGRGQHNRLKHTKNGDST